MAMTDQDYDRTVEELKAHRDRRDTDEVAQSVARFGMSSAVWVISQLPYVANGRTMTADVKRTMDRGEALATRIRKLPAVLVTEDMFDLAADRCYTLKADAAVTLDAYDRALAEIQAAVDHAERRIH